MKIFRKIKNFHIKCVISVLLIAAFFTVGLPVPLTLSAASPTASATFIFNGLGVQDAPQRPATIGLEITGQVPTAQTGNSRLNSELDELWEAQYDAFIQNHMAGALSINSNVEHFISGEYVSTAFIKEAASVSTTAAISTSVVDTTTNTIITLPDFNVNILQLINNHISSLIAADPHNFSNFTGIDADHPFYLDGDRLVIPLGSAELIPTERGIHTIELSISSIEEESFPSSHFRILPPSQYNTIMIRVGDVMRRFGYDIEWVGDTRTVKVSMDGILVSTITIDENAYYYHGGPVRELEVSPMIHNGQTYVPLSFFNEVVGMPTTVDSDSGTVIVSRYNVNSGIASSVYYDFLN